MCTTFFFKSVQKCKEPPPIQIPLYIRILHLIGKDASVFSE